MSNGHSDVTWGKSNGDPSSKKYNKSMKDKENEKSPYCSNEPSTKTDHK